MDQGLAERSGGDAPKSEIRIVSRKRSSSVDGALIVDWSSTGEGDVPEGYVEMGEMGDNSAILLHELIPITTLWRTIFGHAIISMHWGISPVSASLPNNYWKEWTV